MKYQALEESEVMKKLVRAILNRAATDMLKSRVEQEKLDAEYFIMSEYCELMCYVAHKEYTILRKVVERKEVIESL